MAAPEDANPTYASAATEFEAFRSSSKGFISFVRTFRNVQNAPFACDPTDLVGSLVPISFGCLVGIPEPATAEVERQLWELAFADGTVPSLFGGQAKYLLTAAETQVGTHTAKIPNPNAPGPGGLFSDAAISAEAGSLPYVSSMTTKARFVIGAAGNATLGKAHRFLCLRLRIGDEVVEMARDLAIRGRVYSALLEMGLDRDVLDQVSAILAKRLSGDDEKVTRANGKSLFWPSEAGDIVISPVHPYAIHVETFMRVKERRALDHDLKTASIRVGGSQPQNAGFVNGDLGGWHTHLYSLPPKTGSREARLLFAQTKSGKVIFGKIGASHPALSSFRKITQDSRSNDEMRSRIDAKLRIMAYSVAEPLRALVKGAESEAPLALAAVENLPKPYSAMIEKGFGGLPRSEADHIVRDIVAEVASLPHKVSFDDAMRRRATIAVTRVLNESFS